MRKKQEKKYSLKLYEAIFAGAALLLLLYIMLDRIIVPLL